MCNAGCPHRPVDNAHGSGKRNKGDGNRDRNARAEHHHGRDYRHTRRTHYWRNRGRSGEERGCRVRY